jgi:hypothetical protein
MHIKIQCSQYLTDNLANEVVFVIKDAFGRASRASSLLISAGTTLDRSDPLK